MAKNVIVAKDLYLEYKKNTPIIKDSTFSIKSGSFVFITGPSGSGKSTLLKSFYGELRPQRGILQIGGVPLNDIKSSKLAFCESILASSFKTTSLLRSGPSRRT